jgi:NAD(P)-dependent dehydrogenase (short-subunit alcohol dehydrogenase family)
MTGQALADGLLKGRHVVVTGGGSGLGRAMAQRFASLGAAVTINGRRTEPLDETVTEIRNAGGIAEGITCNVRDAEEVGAFFAEAEKRQGPVQALVNNAAANFLARTETLSANAFDAVVKTNLYGTFFCTSAFARRCFDDSRSGVVLSIATTYAETGSAFVVPSAVSKAGIVAMTRSLAVEWGERGIRLNAIAPGPFPTEGAWSRLVPTKDVEKAMLSRVPVRRFGTTEELAELAAFMISDASAYMNGEVVTLDGGEALAAGGQFNDLARMPAAAVDAMLSAMRKEK